MSPRMAASESSGHRIRTRQYGGFERSLMTAERRQAFEKTLG